LLVCWYGVYWVQSHKSYQLVQKYRLKHSIRACNTIDSQFCDRTTQNKINSSGIYKLQCKTWNKSYVGQTGGSIGKKHREHIRYIKTNNPFSAYALNILNNRHKYGNPEQTMQLLKIYSKGKKVNCWESYNTQMLQQDLLIDEQKVDEPNPLYALGNITK
jgi:hypothetical protein